MIALHGFSKSIIKEWHHSKQTFSTAKTFFGPVRKLPLSHNIDSRTSSNQDVNCFANLNKAVVGMISAVGVFANDR